jgi:hypothetical protein
MDRISWQWPAAVVFAVVFAVLGGLVFTGKMHPEALMALLAWLAPSPYQTKPKEPAS